MSRTALRLVASIAFLLAAGLLLLAGAAVVGFLDTTTLSLLVALFAFGTAAYVSSTEPVPRSTLPLAAFGLCVVAAGALFPEYWSGASGAVLPVVTTLVLVGYVVFAFAVGHALWFDGGPLTHRAGAAVGLAPGVGLLVTVIGMVAGMGRAALLGPFPLLLGVSWLVVALSTFPRERKLPDGTSH